MNAAPIPTDTELRIRQLRTAGDEAKRHEDAEAALRVVEDKRRAAFDARPRKAADYFREADALEVEELERVTHVRLADERDARAHRADRLRADIADHEGRAAAARAQLACIAGQMQG